MDSSTDSLRAFFPALNASLNALAALLLLYGFVLIRRRQFEAHRKVMITAFSVSTLFLVSYLYYHLSYPPNRFGGQGALKTFYLLLLASHVILAAVITPLVLRLLWLGSKASFAKHARLARIVWPLWMYTSVTGVLIYFLLYQWYPVPPVFVGVSNP